MQLFEDMGVNCAIAVKASAWAHKAHEKVIGYSVRLEPCPVHVRPTQINAVCMSLWEVFEHV